MKHMAEVVQFQKKQEAAFMCSACGADRGCDCNAPALEKLAAEKERQRLKAKAWREKNKENQQPRTGTSADLETMGRLGHALKEWVSDPAEEPCADCINDEERWQRSLSNLAGDAVSLPAYWTREFGNWDKFGCPRELAKLATQAAEAWKQIASELNQRIK